MLDIQSIIAKLQRPKLLVRAARFGLDEYRRERDLKRALKTDHIPKSGEALLRLSEIEGDMNAKRETNDATYSIAAHIDVLIAIMSEAQLYEAIRRPRAVT